MSGTSPNTATNETDSLTRWHLRNIFWVCYSFDKDLSLRTGQPPAFEDTQCDLTLPPGYQEHVYIDMAGHQGASEPPPRPFFSLDLRLSMIKSKAYNALYSVQATRKSDAELLRAIRELDNELESWRVSIPERCRPTVSFPRTAMPASQFQNMGTVMLQLNYYSCIAIIHQASSRCQVWGDGSSRAMVGVSSSLALSVEASRSTLLFLESAEEILLDEVFW